MKLSSHVVCVFPLTMVIMGATVVYAQPYPNKPIRIVTGAPGGGADLASRIVAQGISDPLGQQVVVDNRAGGVIPAQIVAKATPDGYTLLLSASSLWLVPFLQDNVPYDPVRDFSPISIVTSSPGVLVVQPALPVKSVKELIALAKASPGALNYASGQSGSATHLAAELFKSMAGVNIVRIPYKGTAQALIDVMSGGVQMMLPNAGTAGPHIKSGKLKALAVTSAQPSVSFPGLPTIAAAGVPGYESILIQGIFAPAKTPEAIVRRLNQEIVRALNSVDVNERFSNAGLETVSSSPGHFAAAIKSEMARMGKVIKDAGIRDE